MGHFEAFNCNKVKNSALDQDSPHPRPVISDGGTRQRLTTPRDESSRWSYVEDTPTLFQLPQITPF